MMTPKQDMRRRTRLTQAHRDYAKGMTAYSLFKVNDQATSNDLVQDTFIKTWGYLVRGGNIVIMKAFLYRVLNHLIIDEYRKRKTTSLDVLLEKGSEPSVENNSERLFNVFDGKLALLLIQHLPIKYRRVMQMRYTQGLSLKEISLITGQSRNAVAVQVYRGLAKLRVLYNHK